MEAQHIQMITNTFEYHAHQTHKGLDYWLARDLKNRLEYGKWDNFTGLISKAKTACEMSGHEMLDHFSDVGKMVELGSGSQRQIDDIIPTRYTCYSVAKNGDWGKR